MCFLILQTNFFKNNYNVQIETYNNLVIFIIILLNFFIVSLMVSTIKALIKYYKKTFDWIMENFKAYINIKNCKERSLFLYVDMCILN